MTKSFSCSDVRSLLPELSSGVADGGARAQAMAHIAGCAECRRELHETTAVLDELILLAPEREPPASFESEILAAVAPTARDPSRAPKALLAAAALLVVAALGAGLVWSRTGDDREVASEYRQALSVGHGRHLAATDVRTATHATVGHAFAYTGDPSWVFMTIADAPASGTFQVQVVTTNHRTIDVGQCVVSDGRGSWGWTLYAPMRDVARIQLLHGGVPIMSGRFS